MPTFEYRQQPRLSLFSSVASTRVVAATPPLELRRRPQCLSTAARDVDCSAGRKEKENKITHVNIKSSVKKKHVPASYRECALEKTVEQSTCKSFHFPHRFAFKVTVRPFVAWIKATRSNNGHIVLSCYNSNRSNKLFVCVFIFVTWTIDYICRKSYTD